MGVQAMNKHLKKLIVLCTKGVSMYAKFVRSDIEKDKIDYAEIYKNLDKLQVELNDLRHWICRSQNQ
jgi:hypothetical protein